jgi:hypothetical protein
MTGGSWDVAGQTRSLHELTLLVHQRLWADGSRELRAENERLRQRVLALEAELALARDARTAINPGSGEEVALSRGVSPDARCGSLATKTCVTSDACPDAELREDAQGTAGLETSRSESVLLSISPCSSVSHGSHTSQGDAHNGAEASTRSTGAALRQRLADAEQAHRRLQRETHLNQVLTEKDAQIRRLKGMCASLASDRGASNKLPAPVESENAHSVLLEIARRVCSRVPCSAVTTNL